MLRAGSRRARGPEPRAAAVLPATGTGEGAGEMAAVYLSSPLPYALPGRIFHRRTLVPALLANDLTVLDPWADEDGRVEEALARHGAAGGAAYGALLPWLAARNADLLRRADAVLAVLDGPEPDAGVATEVGLAAGLGIPVIGWRSDVRGGGTVPAALEHAIRASGGTLHDVLGDAVVAVTESARRRQ